MSTETHIAAVIFNQEPALGFDDIIDEFEISLRSGATGRRSLMFDYDDLVLIDIETLRIGLAWVMPETPDQPYSLVIATGAAPDAANTVPDLLCRQMGDKLLSRIRRQVPVDAVIRASLSEALDSDLLDKIASGLHRLDAMAELRSDAQRNGQAPVDMPPAPAMESARQTADNAFNRLRRAYQEGVQQDRAQTSMIWQAVMASANSMIDTIGQGAEMVRQMTAPEENPYEKLQRRVRTRQVTRLIMPFDKEEYELYGNLLD